MIGAVVPNQQAVPRMERQRNPGAAVGRSSPPAFRFAACALHGVDVNDNGEARTSDGWNR